MLTNQTPACPIRSRTHASLFIGLALFVCLIFTSCLFSTYSSANSALSNKEIIELSAEEREWLKQNPHIRFSTLTDQPPVTMKDSEGRHVGIIADIFSHLSRAIGQELETELLDDNTKVHSHAKAKGMYGSSAIFKTPQHQKEYLLSDPYLVTPFYVFTTKNKLSVFKQANDLKGKRVAIPRNHRAMADYLDKIGSVEVIVNSPLEQMQKVLSGEADAMMGYLNYPYLINKYLMVDLEMAFVAESDLGLHVGVNPEHPLLQSILNKAIATISEQTRQNILAKWTKISREESPQIELTENERAWLAAHPVIRIGVDANYAPYSFRDDDGSYRGIAMEFSDYLSEQLGIFMKVVAKLDWPEIVDGVRERKLDMVTTLAHRSEREAFVNFTKIYLPTPLVIMRRSGDTSISSEVDLEKRIVAMVEGYSSSDRILEEHPDVKPLKVKTAKDGLFAVSTGKADAYVGVLGINLYLANKLGITNLEVASLYGTGENGQRFGVRKDWPELVTILDKALKAMPEGRKRKIFENWLPSPTYQLAITGKAEPLIELSLTEEENAWLAENPVIRLGNSVDWPPFGYINKDGVYSGTAAEYIAAIEKILGITIEPAKLGSWKETVDAARKGEVELLDAVVPTPQRREFLTFTKPYISYPVVLFAHKDVDYIADMSALNGQRVTVIAGSALHDILINNHPEFVIVPTENARAGLLAVEKRKASAFIGNLLTASQVMSREGITNLKVTGETPYRYDLAIGISKDKPILASLLQKALDSIPEEKHNEIYRKWMSVTFEHKTDYTIIFQILVFVTLLLAIFLYWNRRLSREVHQRKHTEEALHRTYEGLQKSHQRLAESELWQRGIFDSLEEGVMVVNPSRNISDVNPACRTIFGYSREEIADQSTEILHVDHAHYVEFGERITTAFEQDKPAHFEFEAKRKNGEIFPSEHTVSLLKSESGEVIGIVSVIRDISTRKQAEAELLHHREDLEKQVADRTMGLEKLNEQLQLEILEHKRTEYELRNSRKDLQTIFDNMQDAFYRADIEGRIIMLSPSAERLMQYTLEELMGKKLADYYVDPDGRKKFLKALKEGGGTVHGYEAAVRNKNGNHVWISTNAHYFYDDEGNINGVEGAIRDISARKLAEEEKEQLQRELQQSQKMEALGKLTGGIAHEYNNMLAIMLGFTDLLKMSFSEQPKLLKYADEIQHAGERAAKLTKKLLTFSRQKTPEAKNLNLNTLLQKQQHMLEKTLTVRIKLTLNLQEDLWQVWLDEGDTEDAIINMSINAMHAIEGNGQLTIQTSNQKINQMNAKPLGIPDGDYVSLSLTDSGCGIDEKIKEKIFDPFFTTKGMEGTGLGLSMVYGFVQNSGGAIKVYSEPGEGTQFTLYFPRYHGASRDQQSEKENHFEDNLIGNKTILVVDDEPALLNLSREILNLHGFKVICAESAQDALNILQHESVDILISDIVMPEMDGYQLAAIVKEKYPEIKIQLASGFTEERNMGMDNEHLQQDLLHKPFSSQALLQRIRAL